MDQMARKVQVDILEAEVTMVVKELTEHQFVF